MVNFHSAVDALAISGTGPTNSVTGTLSETIPMIGNVALCSDSIYTAGRACINFYCSPTLLPKCCFGMSVLCGTLGAVTSGAAVLIGFDAIPLGGCVGTFGARSFNKLGKYALHMGNVTSGKITSVSEIADLVQ